ncbi:MAG: oligosaccharide flippase family protein [Clostridia bacterium]|nr:oligosaccharide flippase family protein [Clostridia bacterium]
MTNKKRFFINAALLSTTSVLMQTVGVSFNVWVSNKIGASGAGLYSLIMSVYVFAVTLANSGITLAATRLISQSLASRDMSSCAKAALLSVFHGLFFGTLAFLLMFFGANVIGSVFLGDSRTVLCLRVLSLSLPFVGMSSALSGYFTAVRRVAKSAAAQLFEQFVRICAVTIFFNRFMQNDTARACVCLVAAGTLAEICSFLFIFFLYGIDKRKHKINVGKKAPPLLQKLLGISLPVAFSAYLRSALRCLEHILIPKCLKMSVALSSAPLALYGVVHGMVMPVLLFPSSFLGAFSSLLIPEITEYQKLEKNYQIKRIMKKVYSATFIFSVCASGIFLAFSKELGMALYNNPDACLYIKLLAPLTIAMYVDSVTDAILKGIGEQVYSMHVNIIDAFLSVILTVILIPKYGIGGYIAVIYISELLNLLLSLGRLIYITDFKIRLTEWLIKPIFMIASAVLPVQLAASFYSDNIIKVVVSILSSALIYLLLIKIVQTE